MLALSNLNAQQKRPPPMREFFQQFVTFDVGHATFQQDSQLEMFLWRLIDHSAVTRLTAKEALQYLEQC